MQNRVSPPQMVGRQDVPSECERAIDDAVREFANQIIIAGWPPIVVYEAIQNVSCRHARAMYGNPDTTDKLGEARMAAVSHSEAFPFEWLSPLTARDVERTIGILPSVETAPAIAKGLGKVLNGTKRRKTIQELGAWLQSLGLVP